VLLQNTDSTAVLQTAEKNGKYAFGWDSDMSAFAPRRTWPAIVNWGPYYIKAVKEVMDGSWTTTRTVWGVKEGLNDLIKISDAVPADVKAKVAEIKAGLKDGSFERLHRPDRRQHRQGEAGRRRDRRPGLEGRHQLLRQGRRRQGAGRQLRPARAGACGPGATARRRAPPALGPAGTTAARG
jgi:hypothetical protein